MKTTKNTIGILAPIIALLVLTVPVNPGFAYTSEPVFSEGIIPTVNSLKIRGYDGKPLGTTRITSDITVTKSGSSYKSPGGSVSEGYCLNFEGKGNYAPHVELSGVSLCLDKIRFIFGNAHNLDIKCKDGKGAAILKDKVFASEWEPMVTASILTPK